MKIYMPDHSFIKDGDVDAYIHWQFTQGRGFYKTLEMAKKKNPNCKDFLEIEVYYKHVDENGKEI